ncbi:MAG: hypothetical protein ACPG5B_05130 [Chitinophagales bacterium]
MLKKIILSFSILFLLKTEIVFSQASNIQKADSLLANNHFFEAAIAYERIIFEAKNEDSDLKTNALLKKSYAYKMSSDFETAKTTLFRIPLQNYGDSVQLLVRYEIALNAFLNKEYGEAESQFVQLNYFLKDKELLETTWFLQILTLNELQRWDEAKVLLEKYLATNEIVLTEKERKTVFRKNPKLKSPKKASALSTFIPGLGQVYGGKIGAGVASLVLQSTFLAFGGYHFYKGFWFTGFTSGFSLFQAFYFGGRENAAIVTEQKNRKKMKRYNDAMRYFILEKEKM